MSANLPYDFAATSLVFVDCELTGRDPTVHSPFEIFYMLRHSERLRTIDMKRHLWIPIDEQTFNPQMRSFHRYQHRKDHLTSEEYPHMIVTGSREEAAQIIFDDLNSGQTLHLVGINAALQSRTIGDLLRQNGHGEVPWDGNVIDINAVVAGAMGIAPPWRTSRLSERIGVSRPYIKGRSNAEEKAVWTMAMYDTAMSSSFIR